MEGETGRDFHTPDGDEPTIKNTRASDPLNPVHQAVIPRNMATAQEELPSRQPRGNKVKPVFCQLKSDSEESIVIPAIHVSLPSSKWEIYPLSKHELGSVWTNEQDMVPWELREDVVSWEEASLEFAELTDCNPRILKAIVRVLREGEYFDGVKVTKDNWKWYCKYSHEKIKASFSCRKCNTAHDVAPRFALDIPCKSESFECAHIGLKCNPEASPSSVVCESSRPKLLSAADLQNPGGLKMEATRPPVVRLLGEEGNLQRRIKGWLDESSEGSQLEEAKTPQIINHNQFETFHSPDKPHYTSPYITQTHQPKPLTSIYDSIDYMPPINPSQFINGVPVNTLKSPDPTAEEIQEYAAIRRSNMWDKYTSRLIKWKQAMKEGEFAGNDAAAPFFAWHNSMKTFFDTWSISNSVVRGMLTPITFTKSAMEWWRAHTELHPRRIITMAQLLEMIRTELVPRALPTASHKAWWKLEYKGNVDQYLQHISDLMRQYPIAPRVANSLAGMPFGDKFSEEIEAIDDRIRRGWNDSPNAKETNTFVCRANG